MSLIKLKMEEMESQVSHQACVCLFEPVCMSCVCSVGKVTFLNCMFVSGEGVGARESAG